MASELEPEPEPEVPAIDQSLLECSAEETAGVSAWTPAGRDVRPSQAAPGGRTWLQEIRSGRAQTWGNHRVRLSVLP